MSALDNNVKFIWQLLSQFVSWEFCRYVSEQNEGYSSEIDALTFLRNMIVQRTNKSESIITKHEIVAKFIMEAKAAQSISRMPYILTLSESVKRICPELESDVSKLVYHLEHFFKVLESTDDYRKELILSRINDAISDFSKLAERHLPHPDLLQVIESWKHHHGHVPQKSVKKIVYNTVLSQKVLRCLKFESITPSEAKLIAVALEEDNVFKKFLSIAEAEPTETEADSEQFSLQSSQPNENIFSQESGKNVGIQRNQVLSNAESMQFSSPPLQEPDEIPENPPQFIQVEDPVISPLSYSSLRTNPLRINADLNQNVELENCVTDNNMQLDPSCNEQHPDEFNSSLHERLHAKFKAINNQNNENSDSDTSDCDKNAQFKFLTPTFYKRFTEKSAPPKSQIIWMSDNESNDSSVVSTVVNSQRNDPNWSTRLSQAQTQALKARKKTRLRTQTQISSSPDSDANSYDPPYSTKTRFDPIPTAAMLRRIEKKKKKKVVRTLESDSSESIHSSLVENQGNLLERLQQLPSTSLTETEAEHRERPSKKRKGAKTTKLFRSPDVSLEDFVNQARRPGLQQHVTNEVPVHRGTNTIAIRKNTPQIGKTSIKRQKCKQCKKAFKTSVALKRHVFLQHNPPPSDDSDCDDM